MEILNHLMIGPLVLILALLYKYMPSKIKALSFSGVDTFSDKKVILESMRYSAKLMVKAALFTTVFQIGLVVVLSKWTSVSELYAIPISVGVLIMSLIVVLLATQHHLRKEFLFTTTFSPVPKSSSAEQTAAKKTAKADTPEGKAVAEKRLGIGKRFRVKKTQPALL